ncbi:crotonase/enoyl-CoA hydratase family protein [Nocardia nova]|uniref:crotonase/enoyl-CoA hydratase family protein n=1 Tax=Nocardia nova TaxID=37330 RepID=UPI003405920A
MDTPLDISGDGAIRIWTINQPETGNAITDAEFTESFDRAVDEANADLAVRVVILTGAGKLFSSGGNVREMADHAGMFGVDERRQRQAYATGIQRIPQAAMRLEVPLIAAVNGAAVGAGCDLAMMSDIRIASERAWFAESFVQIGLIPGDGGSWFLPRAVGWERAAEMTFTGDRVDAATALEWGMVGRVVPPEELMAEAEALAERIAKNPPHALRMAKRLLHESKTARLDSVLAMAAAMQPLAHMDPEHQSRLDKWRSR